MVSRLASRAKRHPLVTFFVLKRPGRRAAIVALVVIFRTRSLSELRELWLQDDPLAREVVLVRDGLGLLGRGCAHSGPERRRW